MNEGIVPSPRLPAAIAGLEIRDAGDDVLVHDLTHRKVHVLNRSAAFVLRRCDGSRSAAEIARDLATASGADASAVERDVAIVLREFDALRLLMTGA